MKLSINFLLAAVVLAAAKGTSAKDTNADRRTELRELGDDDQFFAKAFGAVQSDYPASEWKDFLIDGQHSAEYEVDLTSGAYEPYDAEMEQNTESHDKQQNDRELWYYRHHDVGWFSIHPVDRKLEVKKNSDDCFGLYEGIEKDGWRFGITDGRIPNTNETDTYLMLFEEWHPYLPVYQAFQGAFKLCIGEKSKNIAYMIIYTRAACHLLIGKPDSGRRDHLPILKIRDQDYGWRRQRNLRNEENGKDEAVQRELWYDNDHYEKTYGKGVVVRFRDGPGKSCDDAFSVSYQQDTVL